VRTWQWANSREQYKPTCAYYAPLTGEQSLYGVLAHGNVNPEQANPAAAVAAGD
jgi:hypothetical protein